MLPRSEMVEKALERETLYIFIFFIIFFYFYIGFEVFKLPTLNDNHLIFLLGID